MPLEIVSTFARPDLVPVTARWRREAFFRDVDPARTASRPCLMPQTLVLLAAGAPVGMASLVAHDLEERPDLSP